MPKLTKKVVEAATPKDTSFFVWCSDLPGFGVRVFPTGKRVYYADYRNAAGTRKRMSLGPHGKITTEEARKLALSVLGGAVKGEDPAEERATRRKSMTVADLCDDYLEAVEKGLIIGRSGKAKKASTLYVDRGRIARHIKPLLGKKLVIDLAPPDIVRFIRDVTAGKTATVEKTDRKRGVAIVEGGAGTAARTAGLLGGVLSYAVSIGVIPTNPATGVKRPADNKRERRLSSDEYRALGKALAASEAERDTRQGIDGVRLLALTGCRSGEIVGLKWTEVDEAGCCLRFSDTKTGASVRPIGSAVFDVLATIPRSSAYVLPAVRGEGAFGGLPGAWARLMKRAGLVGVTPHTLRHSFASVAGDLGYADSTIGALLGHAGGNVTSRYVHRLDAVLIAVANKVAGEVYSLLDSRVSIY